MNLYIEYTHGYKVCKINSYIEYTCYYKVNNIILYIDNVGKTGDLSRTPGAGPGLRGLGFRDRALGPRKPVTK